MKLLAGVALSLPLLGLLNCGGSGPPPPPPETCQGVALSCGLFVDQPTCEAQLGCTFGPGICSGTPDPCASEVLQASCLAQAGCQWDATVGPPCHGIPTPCAMLTGSQCETGDGCISVSPPCEGAPNSCGSFTDAQTCTKQVGCDWK